MKTIASAWRIKTHICDATVSLRFDGVVISIPNHAEVQLFLSHSDITRLSAALSSAADLGKGYGRWKCDVIAQGGGVTTKVATAQKLEADGLLTILEIVYGKQVLTRFGLDPSRAACAAEYKLTDAGEQIRHMLENGGQS